MNAAIALLKERGAGRATFLPLTNIKANPVRESDLAARGGYVGLASELVQCDDRYRVVMDSLLGLTPRPPSPRRTATATGW